MIRLAHFSQPESQGPAGHRCGKDAMKFQEVVGMIWVLALVKEDIRVGMHHGIFSVVD